MRPKESIFVISTVCVAFPIILASTNFSGKSYYFKTSGNNAFTVYNRMHFLNHNISDYDVNPHAPPQNVKLITATKNRSFRNDPSEYYLDPEWDYEHARTVNKTELPGFVKKFYQNRLKTPNRTETVRIYFNANCNRSEIIKFDVDQWEGVQDAEMYFYWPLENSSRLFKASVVLRLYQIEQLDNSASNESNSIENPDIHKLFNVIYVAKAQKGWQTFKIKKPLENWQRGEPNLGLLLTISTYDDNKLISIFNDTNRGSFRTFAVLRIDNNVKPALNQSISMRSSDKTSPECSRRPWLINFKHIQWDSFVLYPEDGVMAYECTGKCQNRQAINHVKLRLTTRGSREKICCVPVEFYSLPIMFLDKFGNVVLKNYDDLVVKRCGCR